MMQTGRWIWGDDKHIEAYNQAFEFFRKFEVSDPRESLLRITADSRYRVWVNGQWINDGPGKAYPEHWTYDSYELAPYLKLGANEIRVLVRSYGIGTFHQLSQRGGLLAEIELEGSILGTDASWLVRPYTALEQWVPKVSVQMEPVESYNADCLPSISSWAGAVEICAAESGPWRDLQPRRSAPLTQVYCEPVTAPIIRRLQPSRPHFTVPVTQLAHPGLIEANHFTSRPVVLTAQLEISRQQPIDFASPFWRVEIDGKLVTESIELAKGCYTVRFYCQLFYGHKKDLPFPYLSMPELGWSNWQLFIIDDFKFADNDILFGLWFAHPEAQRIERDWLEWLTQHPPLPPAEVRSFEQIFYPDFTAEFCAREPAEALEPQGDPLCIQAAEDAVIELCYDLGVQRCGYFDFEMDAPAGTVIDLHLVEYIREDGVVQHTAPDNRNGMRYRSHAGINRYCSLKRRSGRYLFVSVHAPATTVLINRIGLIESTAAVQPVQSFHCSDDNLNQIFTACQRTLKLCMEDIFTDCPLYEQTLWIGDARNQALYAAQVYGDYSISERSLELGAQSLERFPIVGCQVPSTWDCLLPAWSFLWGIHVWEHYFITGDQDCLERLWPAVVKNIEGAQTFLNEQGLFSGEFWNMLDWAPMDQEHATVVHNSILMLACISAGIQSAEVLGELDTATRFEAYRSALKKSILSTWDSKQRSYPDAILADGMPSKKCSQHSSALALIADVLPEGTIEQIRKNLLSPPDEIVQIQSPFAGQFYCEALMRLDEKHAIIENIRAKYKPMIDAGATTVWETYPHSTCSPEGFPTRSHCHAWSCGPLQFFNQIILGVEQTEPAGRAYSVSPYLGDLQYASGEISTPQGPIFIEWNLVEQTLWVKMAAPAGVKLVFVGNASHNGYQVTFVSPD